MGAQTLCWFINKYIHTVISRVALHNEEQTYYILEYSKKQRYVLKCTLEIKKSGHLHFPQTYQTRPNKTIIIRKSESCVPPSKIKKKKTAQRGLRANTRWINRAAHGAAREE